MKKNRLTNFGRKHTKEEIENQKRNQPKKFNEKNSQWMGNNVGYNALHEWVRRKLKKPDKCPDCKLVPPYEVANKSGKYERNLSDWEWLCRKCHMIKDGRIEKLKIQSKMAGDCNKK